MSPGRHRHVLTIDAHTLMTATTIEIRTVGA